MSSSWLPGPLSAAWVLAYLVVGVVHVAHLLRMRGQVRWWHAGHVVMALGMVDMSWPWTALPVGAGVAELVFALTTIGAVVAAGLATRSAPTSGPAAPGVDGRGASAVWSLQAVDHAAMVAMFALAAPMSSGPALSFRWAPLSVLLAAWFALEAVAWGSGPLALAAERALHHAPAVSAASAGAAPHAVADHGAGRVGGPAGVVGRARQQVAVATSDEDRRGQRGSAGPRPWRTWSLRASLAVMSLGMAYMFVVMQFGMSVPGPSGTMDMPGM